MRESMNMGGSVVSKNILYKSGKLKWCFRESSINKVDNGWRFLSEIDTDDYLANASNMVICDWGTIFEIEPAIAPIFDMPVGTELTLIYEGRKKFFVFTETGEKVDFH